MSIKYEITATSIVPAMGGFSTKAAYRVVGADGINYFVKVYDKSQPTTHPFVERIDKYMPTLDWLSKSPSLRGCVLTPIPSREGSFKVETNVDVYVVFLYVHGKMPGIQGITKAQTIELAKILANLHEVGSTIPHETPGLAEDISLSFCDNLIQYLSKSNLIDSAISKIVSPYVNILINAANETLRLRDTIRMNYTPLVLCHGDAHGNNLIQSERLVLADWEDLRWAPVEADLFIHAWHPHGRELLKSYSAMRQCYHINLELLNYYVLRRRIEDVWVDIQRLTEESPDDVETSKLLDWIRVGVKEIKAIYSKKSR